LVPSSSCNLYATDPLAAVFEVHRTKRIAYDCF
jgi:hypothetical protein